MMTRRAKPSRRVATDRSQTRERIQKTLAAAGIGSRREIERWIQGGRLLVNGKAPALGSQLTATDRITLDGRPVRLRPQALDPDRRTGHVLLLNRSPGTPLDIREATSRATERLQLPRGVRWLAVQPMPPVDGGLEILSDDGAWVYRVTRGLAALTSDYLLRMRGPLTDVLVAEFHAATDCESEPMTILEAAANYGERRTHWLTATVRATRPAVVRHWWAARGMEISRLMRVRLGPMQLLRDLPRGATRPMTSGERSAFEHEIAAAHAEPSSEVSLLPAP
jgi:23S rRNA pseudouridine2605 synthase